MTKIDPFQRFIDAQSPIYEEVLAELSAGQKTGHWMWFIFPQHVALGSSDRAKRYGLYGVEQAREYLAHPVLGYRLIECCQTMLEHRDRSAASILGELDSRKFHSCLTLFHLAAPNIKTFVRALEVFYAGKPDQLTLDAVKPE